MLTVAGTEAGTEAGRHPHTLPPTHPPSLALTAPPQTPLWHPPPAQPACASRWRAGRGGSTPPAWTDTRQPQGVRSAVVCGCGCRLLLPLATAKLCTLETWLAAGRLAGWVVRHQLAVSHQLARSQHPVQPVRWHRRREGSAPARRCRRGGAAPWSLSCGRAPLTHPPAPARGGGGG